MAENKEIEKKSADKPVVKKKNSDKPSFWSKVKKFFRDCWSELKKITWSSKKDVKTNTILVIVSIAIVGVVVFALDWLFSNGITLLGKLY